MDTPIDLPGLLLLLQTGDSSFPTGGYAHSWGLEELVRMEIVRDVNSLSLFLREQLLPGLENLELPYLHFAHDAARSGDVHRLCELDRELSAIKLPREAREASVQIGTRRLQMQLKLFPNELARAFGKARDDGEVRGHYLVVSAIQMAAVLPEAALGSWSYLAVAGSCAAAMKLIRIGQESCQGLIGECMNEVPKIVARALTVAREDAGYFNPLLDLAAMRHERAFERLFIS